MTEERPGPAGDAIGLVSLVAHGILDGSLAATVWLLLEGGCPLVVASEGSAAGRGLVLDALVPLYPASRRRIPVTDLEPDDAADTLALAGDLGAPPFDPAVARAVAGAASILDRGLALAVGLQADSLERVLAAVANPAVRVSSDRASYLGLILILEPGLDLTGPVAAAPIGPVRVAHYLRPLSRDAGGHLQRLPPAVLASRDATTRRLEDFSWGVVPELAARVGRTAPDFEREVAGRAGSIRGWVEGHRA